MPRTTKKKLPLVALDGITILPSMIVQFDITRNVDIITSVEAAMRKKQVIFVVSKQNAAEELTIDNVATIGTICSIKELLKLPGGIVRVHLEGITRGRLESIIDDEDEDLYIANVTEIKKDQNIFDIAEEAKDDPEKFEEIVRITAMVRTLRDLVVRFNKSSPRALKSVEKRFSETKNLSDIIDQMAGMLPITQLDRQNILEAVDINERFEIFSMALTREIEVDSVKKDLADNIRSKVEKNQREYVLREQMHLIKKELGDDGSLSDEEHFKEEVNKLNASDDVKEKINKEIERFSRVPSTSSEGAVIRGYIETLLELPWDKSSKDNNNINRAQKILDDDHYGLKQVKERVLEFLSVRALTKLGDSPIICLVGPPGTGKTSIARSVARALNKKYIRISLGGVRDEAEIRGHRRTYIGAMPGRIAAGLRQAGVKNPLMLLDEIDKVSSDYKGDTSSALLEVLDSEQNCRFRDHYIEIPLDLSEVLFIATANDLNSIPRPLRDRMEIIEVSSYTENEKFHIAKEHLIKKQFKANGIKAASLSISDDALKSIISNYTKEAGVRQLERKIGQICRKAARMILQDGIKKVKVTPKNLQDFLGIEKYHFDMANEKDEIGIVRGLAWTQVGGDTLQIEVNIMPGKGEIILTGQLGDVMKESAQAGISYIRSIAGKHKISADFFKKNDFHIHIPEGSVPKDGPSAGITMATALYSAIIKKPVNCKVAMTGEITLRGRVLAIGGLKEKLLAAKTAGILKVLVPAKNKPDVEDIDKEITEGLEIVYVETMDEVIKEAIK